MGAWSGRWPRAASHLGKLQRVKECPFPADLRPQNVVVFLLAQLLHLLPGTAPERRHDEHNYQVLCCRVVLSGAGVRGRGFLRGASVANLLIPYAMLRLSMKNNGRNFVPFCTCCEHSLMCDPYGLHTINITML